MKISLIDYGAGNIRSVYKSFCAVAAANDMIAVTSDAREVETSDYIVLPGVGAFGDCMDGLGRCPNMVDVLDKVVQKGGRPFMGICVGMQLLAEKGYEYGVHDGLGYIKGNVRLIDTAGVKIPHMGWNTLRVNRRHPVIVGTDGADVYFVHSYCLCDYDNDVLIADVEYGGDRIAAAVAKDNIIGLQFHPEKSQKAGLRIIADFLRWRP